MRYKYAQLRVPLRHHMQRMVVLLVTEKGAERGETLDPGGCIHSAKLPLRLICLQHWPHCLIHLHYKHLTKLKAESQVKVCKQEQSHNLIDSTIMQYIHISLCSGLVACEHMLLVSTRERSEYAMHARNDGDFTGTTMLVLERDEPCRVTWYLCMVDG